MLGVEAEDVILAVMSQPTVPVHARQKPPAKANARAVEAAFARIRDIAITLPDVAESVNHERPCFAVRGKTFVMFMDNHHGDGRLAIWCKAPPDAQAMIVESDPARYFVPPYVGPRGWIGARLDTSPDWAMIAACIEESYELAAPKRMAAKRSPKEASSAKPKRAATQAASAKTATKSKGATAKPGTAKATAKKAATKGAVSKTATKAAKSKTIAAAKPKKAAAAKPKKSAAAKTKKTAAAKRGARSK
ncbi:Hypothetical protein A7982_11807 [Minicystis rosea]|nr:Hypothetical protein A7982_11807 [Minicystis rosea]